MIEIAPDGQVRGIVNDIGCRITGLGRELVTPRQASLDAVSQHVVPIKAKDEPGRDNSVDSHQNGGSSKSAGNAGRAWTGAAARRSRGASVQSLGSLR